MSKSPTSRQGRSWRPSASNRLPQAGVAGSGSNAWASRFLAKVGAGWYRRAQRDRTARFYASFVTRTAYPALIPTLHHAASPSRLLHQRACGLRPVFQRFARKSQIGSAPLRRGRQRHPRTPFFAALSASGFAFGTLRFAAFFGAFTVALMLGFCLCPRARAVLGVGARGLPFRPRCSFVLGLRRRRARPSFCRSGARRGPPGCHLLRPAALGARALGFPRVPFPQTARPGFQLVRFAGVRFPQLVRLGFGLLGLSRARFFGKHLCGSGRRRRGLRDSSARCRGAVRRLWLQAEEQRGDNSRPVQEAHRDDCPVSHSTTLEVSVQRLAPPPAGQPASRAGGGALDLRPCER
jgi:hypothetical protein